MGENKKLKMFNQNKSKSAEQKNHKMNRTSGRNAKMAKLNPRMLSNEVK
jgi:hypothetical protein